jgi:hypothetical protein
VRRFAAPRFRLGQQVAAALAQRGTLGIEQTRRFGLLPARRQRLLDRQAREELLATARLALASATQPPQRVLDLLALVEAADLVDRLADPQQRSAARRRINRPTSQAPTTDAVGQAVAEVQAEVRAAVRRRRTAAAVAAATGGTHGG